MYNYIKGIISLTTVNSIVIDNQGIGYNIFVANPYSFEVGSEYKVYVYTHQNEYETSLYGFKTEEEKSLFLRLIDVKGLGPKVALPMFATGSVAGIIDAIDRENVIYLTKFPKVGDKLARQIILDLKGKLAASSKEETINNELVDALESLGYKKPDIKKVLPNVDMAASIENQIKEALKLLLKG
ncbi:MAG: Holliday junction branch migration protein RuvA [Erysipelotrichales bacterium]|nr:Holliday junction branch migration protein RuvA [Erysipelotrichales bacterium]